MNIAQNKILLQRLAADYCLGTLRGAARRRFEALARQHVPVRQAIRVWQDRLAGLTELQPAQAPPEAVWRRIEIALKLEREAARRVSVRGVSDRPKASLPWWRQLLLWQGLTAGALSLALLAWLAPWSPRPMTENQALAPGEQTPAVLALMLDANQRPAWLASWDAGRQQLLLQDLLGQAVPAGHSLQLWAVPEHGAPRSLGLLGQGQPGRLAAAPSRLEGASLLAISLEVAGGVPEAGGPKGPILFKGPLLQRTL